MQVITCMSKHDPHRVRNQRGRTRSLSGPLRRTTRSGLRLSNNGRPSRYVAFALVAAVHLLVIVALRVELSRRERDNALAKEDAPALIVSFLELVEPSPEEPP